MPGDFDVSTYLQFGFQIVPPLTRTMILVTSRLNSTAGLPRTMLPRPFLNTSTISGCGGRGGGDGIGGRGTPGMGGKLGGGGAVKLPLTCMMHVRTDGMRSTAIYAGPTSVIALTGHHPRRSGSLPHAPSVPTRIGTLVKGGTIRVADVVIEICRCVWWIPPPSPHRPSLRELGDAVPIGTRPHQIHARHAQ